jgi:hypothetical protein
MMRTRVAAKFLPHAHVPMKQTNINSDVVNTPQPVAGTPFDSALSIDESQTSRIQEYWATFKMSVAQVEEEEHVEATMGHSGEMPQHATPVAHPGEMAHHEHGGMAHHHMSHSHRASTGVSLALRTANVLAQAEDLILFNGQNAVKNSPFFSGTGPLIQTLDPNLLKNLDLGLLNIDPTGNIPITAPPKVGAPPLPGPGLPNLSQVIAVHPTVLATSTSPPRYAENTLNAVASAFSVLQGLAHYEHYALALSTIPYADLHQALSTTLIEPVEPISHLIKAGIHGSGTLPPFDSKIAGLPVSIGGQPITGTAAAGGAAAVKPFFTAGPDPNNPGKLFTPPNGAVAGPSVLYTGVLVSLSGNTMDHVRGRMDDHQDVIVAFNQKDANEAYRFRVVERFALRLKDPSAVIVLLFLDC